MWEELKEDIKNGNIEEIGYFIFGSAIVGVIFLAIVSLFWFFTKVMFTILFIIFFVIFVGFIVMVIITIIVDKWKKYKDGEK